MSVVSLVVRRACRTDGGGAATHDASLTLRPTTTLEALKSAVRTAFAPELDGQEFELTDLSSPPLADDAAVARVLASSSSSAEEESDASAAVLWVVSPGSQALGGVAKERVTFAPHPKTMTMAGDYEYYAAQGRQPLAFAVAELVDNSLRATAGSLASTSSSASDPPRIEVTVALDSERNPTSGLVSVWDNGTGMSKAALNAWAVMNLAVAERSDEGGAATASGGENNLHVSSSPALAAAPDALASARHLNGDLSYFGVGSKNAAFFLGRRVGVSTSRAGEGAVRELALDAEALEARYASEAANNHHNDKREEAVYAEDLVHRDPGDPSTLFLLQKQQQRQSPTLRSLEERWVASEPGGELAPSAHWTRVTVSSLKPSVLRQLAEDSEGTRLCGALAHLYHYYLHGARGRKRSSGSGNGDGSNGGGEEEAHALAGGKTTACSNPLPDIVVRGVVAGKTAWECRLADVKHDLESRSLAAAASEFEFALHVPGKASSGSDGIVAGVLRYFPFEGERETVPDALADADAAAAVSSKNQNNKKRPASGGGGSGNDQRSGSGGGLPPLPLLQRRRSSGAGSDIAGGAIDMTQGGRGGSGGLTQRLQLTQHHQQQNELGGIEEGDEAAAAVQVDVDEENNDKENDDEDDASVAAAANAAALSRLRGPCLEAFWQGRLIPGARVESLPFIDAVRSKLRSAGGSARDAIPDEVFGRLRGALFFGPAWLVTRNKLTFRDDLRGLLSEATGESAANAAGGGGAGGATSSSLERRFREWLARCHASLDKRVRYENLAPPRLQATAREAHGEGVTAFERASEGGVNATSTSSSYSTGQLVRLAVKPAIIGRILYFHVPTAGASPGAHGGGYVTVSPLPERLWGGVTKTVPFRRLSPLSFTNDGEETTRNNTSSSAHVTEEEAAAHVARELARAPSAVRLIEPLKVAASGGKRLSLSAGETLPETGASALAGGAGTGNNAAAASTTRVTRAMIAGKRVSLVMVQRLWFLGGGGGGGEGGGGDDAEMEEADDEGEAAAAAAAAASKKQTQPRRGARKGKGAAAPAAPAAEEETTAGGEEQAPSSSRTLVLEVENRTPSRDGLFRFSKISGGLRKSGRYELEYELLPRLPGGSSGGEGSSSSSRLVSVVPIDVAPGSASSVDVSGPARAAASAAPLPLGAPLPALEIIYRDEFGNAARPPRSGDGGGNAVELSVVKSSNSDDDGDAQPQPIDDLRALSTTCDATESGATLSRVRVIGAEGATGGISVFSSSAGADDGNGDDDEPMGGQQRGDNGNNILRPAPVSLLVSAPLSAASSGPAAVFRLPLRLLPGAPVSLRVEDDDEPSSLAAALAAGVPAGAPLPTFFVSALDAWGNRTAPLEGSFTFELEVSSPLLAGEPSTTTSRFAFDPRSGLARVEGLVVSSSSSANENNRSDDSSLALSLVVKPLSPAAADAVDAAGATAPLSLPLSVQPSRAPARLQLLLDGRPLPFIEDGAERTTRRANDGEGNDDEGSGANADDTPTARLSCVPAGASVSGLALRVLDAAGRPVDPSHPGSGLDVDTSVAKLQVSWMRGHKKVKASDLAAVAAAAAVDADAVVSEGLVTLPPLEAPERVGEEAAFWVRLKFSGRGAPLLESNLCVSCRAGAPRSWQLRLVDGGVGGNNVDVEGATATGAKAETSRKAEGDVFAGVPFVLEVEALDEFDNRCPFDPAELPTPKLSVARLPGGGGGNGGGRGKRNKERAAVSDCSAPWLECEPATWEGSWSHVSSSSGGESSSAPLGDVFTARGVVRGSTGRLLVEVRDFGGGSEEGGGGDETESMLSADALELVLGPGPPATLAFDPLPSPFGLQATAAATKEGGAAAAGAASSSTSTPVALGLALALPPLTVRVLDACGNAITSGPSANGADVALLPGALATDGTGRAAAVSAASAAAAKGAGVAAPASASSSSSNGGAIKARLVDGVATFENVRIAAAVACSAAAGGGGGKASRGGANAATTATDNENPFSLARAAAAAAAVSGSYALRAKPASRALAAAFGELEVYLAPSNAVVKISVRGEGGERQRQAGCGRGKSRAAAAAATTAVATSTSLVAGSTPSFFVDVVTEDGFPLPAEVAAAGLRLCVTEVDDGSGGATTATAVSLEMTQAVAVGGSSAAAFSFSAVQPITKSGRYAVTAEWSEPREEVAAAARWRAPVPSSSSANGSNGNNDASQNLLLRSTAIELVVSAGPVASVALDPFPASLQQQPQNKSGGKRKAAASSPAAASAPTLTASNSGGDEARSVLPGPVALQLIDSHGNAVAQAGIKVRLALASSSENAAGAGRRGGGGGRGGARGGATSSPSIPLLEGAAAEEHETDERGRAFIGPVRIAEGTGGGGGANESSSLDLRLVALMTAGGQGEENSIVEALSLPLLFTDGGALAEAIAAAAAERDLAAATRDELESKLGEARAAALSAERDAAATARAVSAARRAVGGGGGRSKDVSASVPDSPGAARKALEAALEKQGSGGAGGERGRRQKRQQQQPLLQQLDLAASHGPPGKPMTKAVNACLADGTGSSSSSGSKIPGVVGVFARLATVDDARLSAVLAAQYRGLLPVVVVKETSTRTALAEARSKDSLPTPDVLCLTHVQPYRAPPQFASSLGNEGSGDDLDARTRAILLPHRSRTASPLARALVAAACKGSDPPLPMPLPHAKVLLSHGARMKQQQQQQNGGGSSTSNDNNSSNNALVAAKPPKGVPAADEWPRGCLGYAFNLVRPTKKGARAALLYPLLGQTLVFESLEAAGEYREHLATRLRSVACGDIVTLDGGRVSSKGVTSGSSFAVPPAASAPWRFGSTAMNQRPRIDQEVEEEEEEGGEEEEGVGNDDPSSLEALVAALDARAAADARVSEAKEKLAREESRLEPRIEAASRAAEEAEERMMSLRDGGRGGGGGCGGGDEEQEGNENDENEAPPSRGKGGGKRRAPLQLEPPSKTPGGGNNSNNKNKRLRKMAA